MKIKKDFILQDVGGASVVVAVGKESENFKGIITLNESAKVLWDALVVGATLDQLASKLTEIYDVTFEQAKGSSEKFVSKLIEAKILEE